MTQIYKQFRIFARQAGIVMADKMTAEQRHFCMSQIHSRDTSPEVKVRRALFADGYRFRLNVRGLPGTPDIVLPKYHTAIFVNGCFWHGHEGCKYYTLPRTNPDFWKEKVRRNKERDEIVISRLEALGWSVETIWECELKNPAFEKTLSSLENHLHLNRQTWEAFESRRREDRAFALEVLRTRRATRAAIEAELREEYHIPQSIIKLSRQSID